MIQLEDLYWKNVGRFVYEQTIDFTKLGSLIQVDGKIIKNGRDTGRSSGSAKTTVFKALDWLFGISDTSTTILQSRLTKESIQVGSHLDWDGKKVHIVRGKKLSITVDGVETTGSSKLTEELLDQIIGMPRDLFRKILHKRQREGGFFLNMGPSETHKFLTSCLGLEGEQAKILRIEADLGPLETTLQLTQNTIENNKIGLEATQNAIVSLGSPPVQEVDPGTIEALKTKHQSASDIHARIKDNHAQEMAKFELSKPKVETVPFDRTNIERLENEVSVIQKEISGFELIELTRQSDTKSKISVIRVDISKLEAVELTRQADAKAKIEPIQKNVTELQNAEKNRQTEVLAKISNNRVNVANSKAAINTGIAAKQEAVKLAEELKKIRAALCPTCDQSWMNEVAKSRELAIPLRLQELRKTITAGMEAEKNIVVLDQEDIQLKLDIIPRPIPQLVDLNAQIENLKLESSPRIIPEIDELESQITRLKMDTAAKPVPEITERQAAIGVKNVELLRLRSEERNHQDVENKKNQNALYEFDKSRTVLRHTHDTAAKVLQDEENAALNEYNTAINKLKASEEAIKRYSDSKAKLDSQKASYEAALQENRDKLASIVGEIEVITEAKKLIKSYLSCSFEDALDSIGDIATSLIRGIPNMETATIQFDGLKETKEGKVKEEVTPLLSMDGEIGVPVKSISGGELSAVDLGIDLSVIKFIEERTGKGIDLFILDEPFTGLDTPCIEDAIEMLRNCSVDKRLLIVEHNPVIAQSIENRITVVRDGLTSNIVQQ